MSVEAKPIGKDLLPRSNWSKSNVVNPKEGSAEINMMVAVWTWPVNMKERKYAFDNWLDEKCVIFENN